LKLVSVPPRMQCHSFIGPIPLRQKPISPGPPARAHMRNYVREHNLHAALAAVPWLLACSASDRKDR
jgi:hypothetical protein